MQVYPVKPEAFLDAILDPQTGENVDLQMNFRGLRAAVDLRQVGLLTCVWTARMMLGAEAGMISKRQRKRHVCSHCMSTDRTALCLAISL